MDQIPAELAAKFKGMLAAQIGDLVNNAVDLVRPYYLWKVVEGAQFGEPGHFDIGYALQERIGNASVDLVRKTYIAGENLESVVGKTAAQFVGPSGAWRPSPMAGGGLSAGMDLGAELREKFIGIHADNRVIAKEVRAAEAVVIADVVIHLPQGVFRAVGIREAQRNARTLRVVGSVKSQQIGTKRIHYKCRIL